MPFLGIFHQKCHICIFFGLEFFKITVVVFEIGTLEFVELQNIVK